MYIALYKGLKIDKNFLKSVWKSSILQINVHGLFFYIYRYIMCLYFWYIHIRIESCKKKSHRLCLMFQKIKEIYAFLFFRTSVIEPNVCSKFYINLWHNSFIVLWIWPCANRFKYISSYGILDCAENNKG